MRMWMVDPRILCRKHLLGEHVELSMFISTFRKKMQINGYIKNNLVEPLSVFDRHEDLVQEILRRGMNHNSELDYDLCLVEYLPINIKNTTVNIVFALDDLIRRCPICAARYQVLTETEWIPKLDSDVNMLTGGEVYNRKKHWESQK